MGEENAVLTIGGRRLPRTIAAAHNVPSQCLQHPRISSSLFRPTALTFASRPRFRCAQEVSLMNDGPVTIVLAV